MDGGAIPRILTNDGEYNSDIPRKQYISNYIPLIDIINFEHNIIDQTGNFLLWETTNDKYYYQLGYDFVLRRVNSPTSEDIINMKDLTPQEFKTINDELLLDTIDFKQSESEKNIYIPYYYLLLQRNINVLDICYSLAPDVEYINKLLRSDGNNFITIGSNFNCINLFIFINKFDVLVNIIKNKNTKEEILAELHKIFEVIPQPATQEKNKYLIDLELQNFEEKYPAIDRSDETGKKFALNNYFDMLYYFETINMRFGKHKQIVKDMIYNEHKAVEPDTFTRQQFGFSENKYLTEFKDIVSIEKNINTDIFRPENAPPKSLDYFNLLLNDINNLKSFLAILKDREYVQYANSMIANNIFHYNSTSNQLSFNTFHNSTGQYIPNKPNPTPVNNNIYNEIISDHFLMSFYYFRLQKKELNGTLPISLKKNINLTIKPKIIKHTELISPLKDKPIEQHKIIKDTSYRVYIGKFLNTRQIIEFATSKFRDNKFNSEYYSNILKKLNPNLPSMYEYSFTTYQNSRYGNCVENTILQMCKLLLWNIDEGTYQIPPSTKTEFRTFFERVFVTESGFNERKQNNIDEWTALINPIPNLMYLQPVVNVELTPDIRNINTCISYIFEKPVEEFNTINPNTVIDIDFQPEDETAIQQIGNICINIRNIEDPTTPITYNLRILSYHAYFENTINEEAEKPVLFNYLYNIQPSIIFSMFKRAYDLNPQIPVLNSIIESGKTLSIKYYISSTKYKYPLNEMIIENSYLFHMIFDDTSIKETDRIFFNTFRLPLISKIIDNSNIDHTTSYYKNNNIFSKLHRKFILLIFLAETESRNIRIELLLEVIKLILPKTSKKSIDKSFVYLTFINSIINSYTNYYNEQTIIDYPIKLTIFSMEPSSNWDDNYLQYKKDLGDISRLVYKLPENNIKYIKQYISLLLLHRIGDINNHLDNYTSVLYGGPVIRLLQILAKFKIDYTPDKFEILNRLNNQVYGGMDVYLQNYGQSSSSPPPESIKIYSEEYKNDEIRKLTDLIRFLSEKSESFKKMIDRIKGSTIEENMKKAIINTWREIFRDSSLNIEEEVKGFSELVDPKSMKSRNPNFIVPEKKSSKSSSSPKSYGGYYQKYLKYKLKYLQLKK